MDAAGKASSLPGKSLREQHVGTWRSRRERTRWALSCSPCARGEEVTPEGSSGHPWPVQVSVLSMSPLTRVPRQQCTWHMPCLQCPPVQQLLDPSSQSGNMCPPEGGIFLCKIDQIAAEKSSHRRHISTDFLNALGADIPRLIRDQD